jgi:hypothetical protein
MPTSTSSLWRMLGLQLAQKGEDEATGAALTEVKSGARKV